jgi:hypothetical protein
LSLLGILVLCLRRVDQSMERKQRVEKRLRGLALAEGRSRLWPVMWLMGLVILRALFMILLRDGDVVVLIGRRLHAEVDVVRTLFQLLLLSLRLSGASLQEVKLLPANAV